jgi:hypothetical protein
MAPLARTIQAAAAVALLAAAPVALAQKMYKCTDASGATVFTQQKCAETPQELEARQKEKERIDAEAKRAKDDAERKKAESAARVRERDKAYQENLKARAEDQKKFDEAQKRLLQGTSREAGYEDGTLAPDVADLYPGPWKTEAHAGIAGALAKNKAKGCEKIRYRQRKGGGAGEYFVHCTTDGTKWVSYLVWPQSDSVKGPYPAAGK